MINLEKFASKKAVIVPLKRGTFQYNRKKYYSEKARQFNDGFYRVELEGNRFEVLEEVVIETEDLPFTIIKGYTFNNNLVFQNFDAAKRKVHREVMAPLFFNTQESFFSVEAIFWEDKNLYYYRPNYLDTLIYEVKERFDNKQDITGLKGATPELKTLFLFNDLARLELLREQDELKKQLEELRLIKEKGLREKEEAEKLAHLMQTIKGRLMITFNRVGGKLLNYSVSGEYLTVDWQLEATGRSFNSLIDPGTFKVVEAGYCMSGDDRRHSISSMVLTAKDYEDDDLIYITRD